MSHLIEYTTKKFCEQTSCSQDDVEVRFTDFPTIEIIQYRHECYGKKENILSHNYIALEDILEMIAGDLLCLKDTQKGT